MSASRRDGPIVSPHAPCGRFVGNFIFGSRRSFCAAANRWNCSSNRSSSGSNAESSTFSGRSSMIADGPSPGPPSPGSSPLAGRRLASVTSLTVAWPVSTYKVIRAKRSCPSPQRAVSTSRRSPSAFQAEQLRLRASEQKHKQQTPSQHRTHAAGADQQRIDLPAVRCAQSQWPPAQHKAQQQQSAAMHHQAIRAKALEYKHLQSDEPQAP